MKKVGNCESEDDGDDYPFWAGLLGKQVFTIVTCEAAAAAAAALVTRKKSAPLGIEGRRMCKFLG